MEQHDTRAKSSALVQAEYDGLLVKAQASLKSGRTEKTRISGRRTRVKMRVDGGDPTVFFEQGSRETLIHKWSKTLKKQNLVPTRIKLAPLWELLEQKERGMEKAQELKKHMIDHWKKEGNKIPSLRRSPDAPTGYTRQLGRCCNKHGMALHPIYIKRSVIECAQLCDSYRECKAFEHGAGYKIGGYDPDDCQLSKLTDTAGCDGKNHNLDFYVKKPRFKAGKPGKVNGCPSEYKKISDLGDCRRAAASFGFKYESQGTWADDYPGCMTRPSTRHVWFNRHPNPKGIWSPNTVGQMCMAEW